MPKADPRVDAYIEKKAAFAQPILRHIRAAVHRACPEAEETLRWSMPSFSYKGQILCQMAAFKAHAAFGFWRSKEITGDGPPEAGMGEFGKLTGVADLPDPATLDALIRKAATLIDSGTKTPRPVKHPRPELAIPADFAAALAGGGAAQANYEGFPPSARREYLEWVIDAKRAETRASRIAQAVEWIADGKKRNWKYEKC